MRFWFPVSSVMDILVGVSIILLSVFPGICPGVFQEHLVVLFSVVFVCVLIALIWFFNPSRQIVLSKIDFVVIVFLLYFLVRLLLSSGLYELSLFKFLSLVGWYVLFRRTKSPRFLIVAIVVAGVIQTILALLQSRFVIDGLHPFFHVTGSFSNPGPLGGFLAISFTLALYWGVHCLNMGMKKGCFLIACAVFMGYGLYLSDSRAAWLAIFFSISLIGFKSGWYKRVFERKRKWLIVSFGIFILMMSIFMYNYKPDSADGRFFVWKVSSKMIIEKPVWGHGIHAFREKYMLYQADYFHKGSSPYGLTIADNVEYPYNEFVKVLVETGVVGAVLLLLLVLLLLFKTQSTLEDRVLHGGVVTLIVFSLFSYPSDVYLFLVLFCMFCAYLQEPRFVVTFRKKLILGCVVIFLVALILSLFSGFHYRRLESEMKDLDFDEYQMGSKYIEENYDRLRHDPIFMSRYAKMIYQASSPRVVLPVLLDARDIYPCLDVYCDLGTTFQKLGNDSLAERFYVTASNMVPARVGPNYCLFKLYLRKGDSIAARNMAILILSKPAKVENTRSLEIKAEVQNAMNLRME